MSRFTLKSLAACIVATIAVPVSFAAPVPKDDPKVRKADTKQRIRSQNNLKQIVLALHNYHDANGRFPADVTDKDGKPLLSWRVLLLPYLEQDNIYKEFKLDEPWNSENNAKLLAKMPDVFRVGFEPKDETKTYYQGFAGPGSLFEPGKQMQILGIADGTVNTLAVVEAGSPVEWTKPADIAYDPKKKLPPLEGPFANALHVATADGDTHTFRPDIDEKTLRRLIEVADGEVVDLDDLKVHFPLTAEEVKEVEKLIAANEKVFEQLVAELKEKQKLLLEVAKQPNAKDAAKRVNELSQMFADLKTTLEHTKKENEELKELLEESKKKQGK